MNKLLPIIAVLILMSCGAQASKKINSIPTTMPKYDEVEIKIDNDESGDLKLEIDFPFEKGGDIPDLQERFSIENLLNLKSISIHGGSFKNLENIAMCTNIEKITMWSNPYLEDISALSKMTKLTYIDFYSQDGIKNIQTFSELPLLEYLRLSTKKPVNLADLGPSDNLKTLDLKYSTVLSLSGIETLPNLKDLSLPEVLADADSYFAPLNKLKHLKKLTIYTYALPKNFASLVPQLESLVIYSNFDCRELLKLTSLVELDIMHSKVTSIRALAKHPSLKIFFYPWQGSYDVEDMEFLAAQGLQLYSRDDR